MIFTLVGANRPTRSAVAAASNASICVRAALAIPPQRADDPRPEHARRVRRQVGGE